VEKLIPSFLISALLINLIMPSLSIADPASGVYLQQTDNDVLFIQIVKSPDGKVAGRGEAITLLSDGKLKDESFPLEGIIDGNQISLKSNIILGWGPSLSGTVDGESLILLTGSGQLNLHKSDLGNFNKEKLRLQKIGDAIEQTNRKKIDEAAARKYAESILAEDKLLRERSNQLPQLEAQADMFILQTETKRNDIVSQLSDLEAKFRNVTSDDLSDLNYRFDNLKSDMSDLLSEFRNNLNSGVTNYNEFKVGLDNFNIDCEKWADFHSPSKPNVCVNYQTYLSEYLTSRTTMKKKYDDAALKLDQHFSQ
jgi:hypothetical protein